ncbi:hypothetical protein BLNAU_9765 [Blattamonas nauphoetae]|uniref:Uncharacterized protein n=1 Tax=Blattamonas nauphoetae TaxID=2049346 RepID=A0ABQ9XUQ4_9EUKA|nr:hypothetical protein BLNAU_9765 [Blattamonas nauphoetae]
MRRIQQSNPNQRKTCGGVPISQLNLLEQQTPTGVFIHLSHPVCISSFVGCVRVDGRAARMRHVSRTRKGRVSLVSAFFFSVNVLTISFLSFIFSPSLLPSQPLSTLLLPSLPQSLSLKVSQTASPSPSHPLPQSPNTSSSTLHPTAAPLPPRPPSPALPRPAFLLRLPSSPLLFPETTPSQAHSSCCAVSSGTHCAEETPCAATSSIPPHPSRRSPRCPRQAAHASSKLAIASKAWKY